jgi:hypothetical protein
MNILTSERGIHPVDWESAAIGAGEIDLASLTMGWPAAQAAECTGAYVANRFHGRAPANFAARLDAARLYLCLRMLGDDRRSPHSGRVPFFDYLRATAIRCGVELPGGDEVAGVG